MIAIVLAAGLGKRLGKHTVSTPKALIKVQAEKLLGFTMDALKEAGVKPIVVTGYEGKEVKNYIEKNYPEAQTVYNPRYEKGSILSLLTALPKVDEDFVILNADHIYKKQIWDIILAKKENITSVCDFDRKLTDDDMKVSIKDGRIVAISKSLNKYDGGYIGSTYCPASSLETYRKAAHAVAETDITLPVEAVLAWLASRGQKIRIADASGHGWWEIDTEEDLIKANREVSL